MNEEVKKTEEQTKKETMLAKIKKHKKEIAVFAGTVAGLLVLKKLSDRYLYERTGLSFHADLYDDENDPEQQFIGLHMTQVDRIFHKEHPYDGVGCWTVDNAEDIANHIQELVDIARNGEGETE